MILMRDDVASEAPFGLAAASAIFSPVSKFFCSIFNKTGIRKIQSKSAKYKNGTKFDLS